MSYAELRPTKLSFEHRRLRLYRQPTVLYVVTCLANGMYCRTIATVGDGDSCRRRAARGSDKKEVTESAFGEGPHGANNEFFINAPFTFPHPVNLAYRYSHSLS